MAGSHFLSHERIRIPEKLPTIDCLDQVVFDVQDEKHRLVPVPDVFHRTELRLLDAVGADQKDEHGTLVDDGYSHFPIIFSLVGAEARGIDDPKLVPFVFFYVLSRALGALPLRTSVVPAS